MPELLIPGAAGHIEINFRPQQDESAPLVLLLHPDPMQGGSMNNKVIYQCYKGFIDCGFTTIRFNFRGVGRSTGKHDKGDGELSDAANALDWAQNQFPTAKRIWICGYSFGAWIAMQLLMRRPEISSFISVAPPANVYDFSFLAPCPTSGLIIYAEKDKVVPPEEVERLVSFINSQEVVTLDAKMIENADHLFTGAQDKVRERVHEYVANHLDNTTVI